MDMDLLSHSWNTILENFEIHYPLMDKFLDHDQEITQIFSY